MYILRSKTEKNITTVINNHKLLFTPANIRFNTLFTVNDKRILIYCFVGLILTRGAIFNDGLSVDDYTLGKSEEFDQTITLLISQGRIFTIPILWLFELVNVNIANIYIPFCLVVLFSQALLITSLFRFTQISNYKYSEWGALLSILHPYHTEILTFKGAMIIYACCMLIFVFGLEYYMLEYKNKLLILTIVFIVSIMIYQIVINYIFTIFLILLIVYITSATNEKNILQVKRRIIGLSAAGGVAIMLSGLTSAVLPRVLGIAPEGRAQLISASDVTARIHDVAKLALKVYVLDEPMISRPVKLLLLLILLISVYLISKNLLNSRHYTTCFGVLGLIALYILCTPGIIVILRAWWPVPRVINHSSFVYGALVIIALQNIKLIIVSRIIIASVIFVSVAFGLANAQILMDQLQINRWDAMQSNRLVARLELLSQFKNAKYLYIDGGKWRYNSFLRTINGDMNMSAFYPKASKIALINHTSGYNFLPANSMKIEIGHQYCLTVAPWPASDSVTIITDLGIVCLEN